MPTSTGHFPDCACNRARRRRLPCSDDAGRTIIDGVNGRLARLPYRELKNQDSSPPFVLHNNHTASHCAKPTMATPYNQQDTDLFAHCMIKVIEDLGVRRQAKCDELRQTAAEPGKIYTITMDSDEEHDSPDAFIPSELCWRNGLYSCSP